jgi:hypothetical protein
VELKHGSLWSIYITSHNMIWKMEHRGKSTKDIYNYK